MPANAIVRARIDEALKEEATVVSASTGLTVSDACRMMLMRVVAEKAHAVLRDARLGNVRSFDSVGALRDDLQAPDRAERTVQTRLQARAKGLELRRVGYHSLKVGMRRCRRSPGSGHSASPASWRGRRR